MIENEQMLISVLEKAITCDLNNYLYDDKDSKGKLKIENVDILDEALRKLGYTKIILIASSTLRKKIDKPKKYEEMIKQKRIIQAPALIDNDWYILELAKKLDTVILSNDKFKDYWDEFGEDWIRQRRKTFIFFEGRVFIKI